MPLNVSIINPRSAKNKMTRTLNFFFRCISFNDFLETVIDRQGDARDVYDEILHGFKMFDYGKLKKEFLQELYGQLKRHQALSLFQ